MGSGIRNIMIPPIVDSLRACPPIFMFVSELCSVPLCLVDSTPTVAAHEEPAGTLAWLRVVLGPQAVVDLVGQVQHTHPQGDPGHVLSPHSDEQTVEVQQLWSLSAAHVRPGLTDPRPGRVGRPPG